jgi:hypothetical protein
MEGRIEVLDALNRFSAKVGRVKLLLVLVYRREGGAIHGIRCHLF